jgi:NitT/TauT family transport system substrate-binding protein
MKKMIWIGILVVVIIIGIGYFWSSQEQPEKYTGSLEKVTLGVESSLLPAAVWVSENKSYFKEEGLDVTIKEFDSGRLSLLAMLKGDEGIDISAAAPTPIMFNSFNRQDFSIFATFAYAYEDIKVIANKDKGITTAADLEGKKIGTPMGTTGQFFTETFLIYNAVSPSDVELVNVAPSDLPPALNEGEVDAIVIWEPHGSSARELLGDKAIRLPSSNVYKTTFNFLIMKDFAIENPEVLKKFLRAIDKATTFIDAHEEESQECHDIVAERLNVNREIMDAHWDEFVFEFCLR